ncbi:MAG: OprO/OprP family phosphate-selective porin [Gemmataceae bacterium]
MIAQKSHLLVRLVIPLMGLLLLASPARAEDSKELQELKARLDRLEKQNAELLAAMKSQQPQSVQQVKQLEPPTQANSGNNAASDAAAKDDAVWKAVNDALKKAKEDEAKGKKDEEEKKKAEGFVVGKDLTFKSIWNNGLIFTTADEAFKMHIGARTEFDTVWFQQPKAMQKPAPVGVGPLDDGFFFRRIRLETDGTMWEVVEWQTEFDFENANQVTFDHLWAGVKEIPYLGTVRVGQHRVPQGLESFSTSKQTEFLERAAKFEAFEQEFGLGVFWAQDYCDRHVTTQAMWHRNEFFSAPAYQGAAFGDGTYAATSRITWLPVWKNNGRCFLHLGASYQIAETPLDRTTGAALATSPAGVDEDRDIVRYRARAEIRDSTGIGAFEGNSTRFVDTGTIIADYTQTTGLELLLNMGPWWIQAENDFDQLNKAYVPASAAAQAVGNPIFTGGYIATGFFLTGETRGYDRRFGRYDRVVPNSTFFCVRDDCDRFNGSLGAWELTYRFSYVDLDSGAIHGGQLNEHTMGVNWYLTPNLRVMANYLVADRRVDAPNVGGWVHGFGIRTRLEF